MKNRYLVLDGKLEGTGIRDKYEGFIQPEQLPISDELVQDIRSWSQRYQNRNRNFKPDENKLYELDLDGIELLKKISIELGLEYKIHYFSDIQAKEYFIINNEVKIQP